MSKDKKYILALIMLIPILLSATLYVDDDWTSGNCGGHTWGEDAFNEIQNAINYAEANSLNGETILVYEGIYEENIDIEGNLSMTLHSEMVSGEYLTETTILQGATGGGDLITIHRESTDEKEITIAGLSIAHSVNEIGRGINIITEENNSDLSVTIEHCIISDSHIDDTEDGDGGGIQVKAATGIFPEGNISIQNCTISDNSSLNGGGISIKIVKDNIAISNCNFSDNNAILDGTVGGTGGGVRINCILLNGEGTNSVQITNCNFNNNLCDLNGAGMSLSNTHIETVLDQCQFNNNISSTAGGLYMFCVGNAENTQICTLSDCIFNNNIADAGADIISGGISAIASFFYVIDSEFDSNHSAGSGGGISLYSSTMEMHDSIVTQNTSATSGGGIFMGTKSSYNGSICKLYDSIITYNIAGYVGNRIGTTGGGIAGDMITNFEGYNLNVNYNESTGASGGGGGIYLNSNSGQGLVKIENSSICNNQSDAYGGGLHLSGIESVELENLEVNDNTVRSVATVYTYFCNGLGLYLDFIGDSGCRISNCQFNSNSLTILGGNPENADGGGVYAKHSFLIMEDCEIKNNSTFWGSGIAFGPYDDYFDAAFISNTIISGNIRHQESTGQSGAVYILDEYPGDPQPIEFTNCTIADNETDETGVGGIEVHGYQVNGEGVELLNCILWGNAGDQYDDLITHITYCDLEEDNVTGLGNISLDPEFTNPVTEDYTLKYNSPCINEGNPSSVYNDPDGTFSDMGYKYHVHDIYNWNYDGNRRTYLWRSFPRLAFDTRVTNDGS
ncbi:MAG: hypothetical protein P9M05_08210, partial [Candidatus Stygibacter australis]|nr:hypothetical protein [Candidatus Stygibacter australis]